MFTRYVFATAFLAAVGCAGLSSVSLRELVHPGDQVFVPLGTTTATARVGDEVALEIGPGTENAADHGFRVTLNGNPAGRSGWTTTNGTLDIPSGNLRYTFRPESAGQYRVEAVTSYRGKEKETLTWNITVTD
jgi:hypothetical protein